MSLTKTGVTLGESTGKMINLNLSGYRKARVWLGEVPDISYPVVEVLEFTIEAKKTAIALRRRAAVEIFVPTGGCFIYGLLEAEFAPEESGQMILQVAVSADTGNQVDWALAAGVDEVCVGLPREYSQSVLECASDAAKILGSGLLRFAGAAHGAVGSSRRIFRQLATTAVRLLTCQPESVSQEELAVLVSTCFR